jgi:type 2 lantibiotic biosynthesis protein LanM
MAGLDDLASAHASSVPSIEAGAISDVERHLLRQLAALAGRTLLAEFSVEQSMGGLKVAAASTAADRETGEGKDDAAYREFIRQMGEGDIQSLLQEYSVLGRLLAVQVQNWVESTRTFFSRLQDDAEAIRKAFDDEDWGAVTQIESGLGDSHCGGEATRLLHFSGGMKLVYKPKDLGIAAAFYDLIRWCNDHGLDPSLRSLTILDQADYGWVEYVESRSCTIEEGTRRYFERLGSLLGLAYLLNGRDLHHSNIVACGPDPVLVDLEVLMAPTLTEVLTATGDAFDLNDQDEQSGLNDSVLDTLLLPRWDAQQSGEGEAVVRNLSGLADDDDGPSSKRVWTDVNTDQMDLDRVPTDETPTRVGTPQLSGEVVQASDYVEEIQEGFEQVYRLFLNHSEALQRDDGPLADFAGQTTRFVVRNTSVYWRLRRRLQHPYLLRDGARHSIELEHLTRGYLAYSDRPAYWPVVESERQDLLCCDIPYFKTLTTSTDLLDSRDRKIEGVFSKTGFETVQSKVERLGSEDLEFQKNLIWASLYSQSISGTHDASPGSSADITSSRSTCSLTERVAFTEAERIVDRLDSTALRDRQGRLSWMALSNRDPRVQRYQVQRVSHDLHHGRCGIALFLAAYNHVIGGDHRVSEMAVKALQPLIRILEDGENRERVLVRDGAVGGTLGLGSYVYTLTQVSQLVERGDFRNATQAAISLLADEQTQDDAHHDLVFGAGGAVLGLLAHYRQTGDPRSLGTARQYGRRLLRCRQTEPQSGLRSWKSRTGTFKTGFSHGASGIAHALCRLYRQTQEEPYLDAANEALAFERTLYIEDAQNWLPHPPQEAKPFKTDGLWSTWCRGATGIGLARVSHLALLSHAEREDLDAAIQTTCEQFTSGVDHICCGNLGRVLFLDTAGSRLDRSRLVERARDEAGHVVQRARGRDSYGLTKDGRDILRPGFLQGLSGVGFALLRLACPDELPRPTLLMGVPEQN